MSEIRADASPPTASAPPAKQRRRLDLGRVLLKARLGWPRSGPRARGWGEYLAARGIDQDVALDAMKYARRYDEGGRSHTLLVYFIQAVTGGPIKIGMSSDPDHRLMELQVGSPFKLRLIGVAAGGRSREAALHERLAAHRLHGEWFADAPEVLAAIAEALQ